MRIDLQIAAHFGKQIAADLFLSILERSELIAEIQTSMASFPFARHELTVDVLAPRELSHASLEFTGLHGIIFGHLCTSVKNIVQGKNIYASGRYRITYSKGSYQPAR